MSVGSIPFAEAHDRVRRAFKALLPDTPDAELAAVMGLIYRVSGGTLMVEGERVYDHGEQVENYVQCAACGREHTTGYDDPDAANVDRWIRPEYHADDCWWLGLRRLREVTSPDRLVNAVKAARDELRPLVEASIASEEHHHETRRRV